MSDLIDRQAAIDAMINSRSNADVTLVPGSYTNGWIDGRKQLLDELLQVIFELPSAQPEPEEFEWCRDCKEYDQTAHCCHRWTKVIQQTVAELKAEPKPGTWIYDGDCYKCNKCGATYSWWADSQTSNYCPNCGARMKEGEMHD
jgi:hypothetical protein